MNAKKTYNQPEIVTRVIDNEISMQLSSIAESVFPMEEPIWALDNEIIEPLDIGDPFILP